MSDKPVAIIKTWQERLQSAFYGHDEEIQCRDAEALELRVAYEALQARVKELEVAAKYADHIDSTPENQRETMLYDTLVERDALKAENEAQAKRIAELEQILEGVPEGAREAEQQRIEMIRHIDTLDQAASADIHKWRGKK